MKQHITKEQWDELEEKQKCKLLNSIEEHASKYGLLRDWEKYFNKELQISIGQMIEFLGDDLEQISVTKTLLKNHDLSILDGEIHILLKDTKYLVDGCWLAVKYKLNGNKEEGH